MKKHEEKLLDKPNKKIKSSELDFSKGVISEESESDFLKDDWRDEVMSGNHFSKDFSNSNNNCC